MVDVPHPPNGQPQAAAQPAPLPTPQVDILFRELPNGARVVVAVKIAGVVFGGVLAVNSGFDTTAPTNEAPSLARLRLETFWRFSWVNVDSLQPDLVVARDMPPEPPRNVRPGPGFRP